jgi:hypothetical protein
MRPRSVSLIAATTLIALTPAGASAVTHRAEIGPEQGVSASLAGDRVTLTFSGGALAFGKKITAEHSYLECAPHPAPGLLFSGDASADTGGEVSGDAEIKTSADGTAVTYSIRLGSVNGIDACELTMGGRVDDDVQARAALTPAGAAWIDETERATRMVDVLHAARPTRAYRSAIDMVSIGGGEVVALDGPDATPPAGKIGYWSKGRAVSYVTTSAAGRRLAIQDLGGGMLRTDALDALSGWTPPDPAAAIEGLDATPAPAGADSGSSEAGDTTDDASAVTNADGVRVKAVAGGKLIVRFTGRSAAAYRRHVAGHRTKVLCIDTPGTTLLGGVPDLGGLSTATLRAPRHGGALRVRIAPAHRDLCVISVGKRTVAMVTVSASARRYLEGYAALDMLSAGVSDALVPTSGTTYPAAATLAAGHKAIVALATPGQRVPNGKVGLWTDGGRRALVAVNGATGKRYVMADEGDGFVRANAFGPLLALIGLLNAGAAG